MRCAWQWRQPCSALLFLDCGENEKKLCQQVLIGYVVCLFVDLELLAEEEASNGNVQAKNAGRGAETIVDRGSSDFWKPL